ncbi:hypothetical protein HIM_03132 [Hirsutella minnesotensis 3608]|nr:hypothetical protein HIM_03132 [Hirsutella minnesotensis 3608]
MDIDDIFKKATGKHKLETFKDPNEIYKSSKLSANGSSRRAHVESEQDGHSNPGSDDDDREAGPAPPPQGDDEPDVDDDEEGRFFGGGITKQESEVLDYIDGADEATQGPVKFDTAWMRKTAQNFERHIAKNAELRAKFESEPHKFIGSEADLDSDVKGLSVLSEHPELYPDFVEFGCAANLVGLLAHENTDIAIDAIEVIGELTEEDVLADDAHWNALVDAFTDADLEGLLVSNLSRLNEDDETDRDGVYHALQIIENLCSRTATAARIGQRDGLLKWLLQRIQRKESLVTQNKQYAAEILAILSQSAPETRDRIVKQDAIDIMLQLVAPYRKLDPDNGGEEEEYMENLFEALTCLVDEPSGKAKFVEAEGVELCLIMLKDGKKSKGPALRLVDHAAGGNSGAQVCIKLVQAGGLKPIFTQFMKAQDYRPLSQLVSILSSLLRLLPADSDERIRALAKFVEKDYEKTAKLVRLHGKWAESVKRAEEAFEDDALEDPEDRQVALLSQMLDAGLFLLQQVDVSLAWLVAEDTGAKRRIKKLLADRDEDLSSLASVIKRQRDALDTTEEESKDMSDMLGTLLEFLQ